MACASRPQRARLWSIRFEIVRSRIDFLPQRSLPYWLLLAFLALVGLTASGARGDLMSLVVVRPAAILLTFYGLCTATREQLAPYRSILVFIAALFVLTGLHLVPLPPGLWKSLPGRELVAAIDQGAGLGEVWRPLSLTPGNSTNAFYSLFIPAAVALLLARISVEERQSLLVPLILFGLGSMMLTMLQLAAPSARGLWLYRITNDGLPVGLFSNRNHNAVYLAALYPMLAVYAHEPSRSRVMRKLRPALLIVIGVLILPLIMAIGSRAGLALGVAALISVPFLLPPRTEAPRRLKIGRLPAVQHRHLFYGVAAALAAVVVVMSFVGGRNEAADRLTQMDENEQRLVYWKMTTPLIGKYFPVGSGAGSFAEVLKANEPAKMVDRKYVNHAHNDFLEVPMTMGLPGAVLMALAAIFAVVGSLKAWLGTPEPGRARTYARLASVVTVLFGAFSVLDYPFRVPTLAALAVILAFWLKDVRPLARAGAGN